MIDARELPPPWARAKNDSGGGASGATGVLGVGAGHNPSSHAPSLLTAWSEIPGISHYGDYVRWLELMLARYAPIATSVEVSNENDGCEYRAYCPQ